MRADSQLAVDNEGTPKPKYSRKYVNAYTGLPIKKNAEILGKGNRKRIKSEENENVFIPVLRQHSFYEANYYFHEEIVNAKTNKILPTKLTPEQVMKIKFADGHLRVDGRVTLSAVHLIYSRTAMLLPMNAEIKFKQNGRVKTHEDQHVLAVYAYLNRVSRFLGIKKASTPKNKELKTKEVKKHETYCMFQPRKHPRVSKKKTIQKTKTTVKVKFPHRVVPFGFFSLNDARNSFAKPKLREDQNVLAPASGNKKK